MRTTLLLLLGLLAAGWAQAAPPATRRPAALPVIERLPHQGLLLDHGWTYSPGDSAGFAQLAYPDRHWQPVALYTPTVAAEMLRPGIGWLRLRWQLGPALAGRPLVLLLNQSAATEVYLNGHLVQHLGTLSGQPAGVRAYNEPQVPLLLPPLAAGPQVLAVRFAWPAVAFWVRNPQYLSPLLSPRLLAADQLGQWQQQRARLNIADAVSVGAMLLLGLLHLTFFFYNASQRSNLFFALFALCSAAGEGVSLYVRPEFGTTLLGSWLPWQHGLYLLLSLASVVWGVRALFAVFNFPTGREITYFWVLVAVSLAAYFGVRGFASQLPLFGLMVAGVVEPVRLTVRALRQRRRGAGFVMLGFGVGLLAVTVQVGVGVYSSVSPAAEPLALLESLSRLLLTLGPALGISLFLAHEFALDARLLQTKLGEVEALNAQTLAQEQEKQALLAAQNDTLEQQVAARTAEVLAQRNGLERALAELRATQTQLIQSEKMASLGELTAGIAHEIQNPLNFVNNFADVSAELLAELKAAQAVGDNEEVAALADDLTQNLGKIHQHGQRASGIVRGMLEHSRQGSGERQPTNVNALADEYLRLAYHGLRAKDKTFNATLDTDLAPDLPLVPAVPGDLGRVLLNLLTNAFYAVQKRQQRGEPGYAPTVRLATRCVNGQVELQVTDNGTGIPDELKPKIFQPFFTTKPTGEGTGLGLSLAYDIMTKGHGGTLAVASTEGAGTTFTLRLPPSP